MKITQVELRSGNDQMVCWVPAEHKLKVGMTCTLQDSPRIWDVYKVYTTQEHFELNRRWNVGGL